MNKNTIFAGLAGIGLTLAAAGCAAPVETTNANANARNANQGVVVNNNTSTVPVASDNRNHAVTREEYEKDKDKYTREAKDAGSTIGQGADDLWLWTKTRAALASADDLRDSTINVDVDNNVVTLKGTVGTADQKARAETVAKGIDGVKSVKNTLAVAPVGGANTNSKATNTKKT